MMPYQKQGERVMRNGLIGSTSVLNDDSMVG